jgi:thiol-disulfide isomerase/thioredoxin
MKRALFTLFTLISTTTGAQDSLWFANYLGQFSADTGTFLPNTSLINSKGEAVTLSDFAGKVIYVDIWATWCGPCIGEFPYEAQLIKRLRDTHLDSSVQVINICTWSTKENWEEAIKKYQLEGVNLFSTDSAIVSKWKIESWPTYLLLNAKGKVIGKRISSPDEVPLDYMLYAATKGLNIIEAAWTEQKHYKTYTYPKDEKDIEGKRYSEWRKSMEPFYSEYRKWLKEHRNKIDSVP